MPLAENRSNLVLMKNKHDAIRKATKLGFERGFKVRFGLHGEVFAIEGRNRVMFKAVANADGTYRELPEAVGTYEAPAAWRKPPAAEPEVQEGLE